MTADRCQYGLSAEALDGQINRETGGQNVPVSRSLQTLRRQERLECYI